MLPLSPPFKGANRKTALLLHFDGTNLATTYPDSSAYNRSIVSQTNANILTAGPKIGTANLANTATTMTALWGNVGSFADFTVEFWFKQTVGSVGSSCPIMSSDNNASGNGTININLNNGASYLVTLQYYDGAGGSHDLSGGATIGGADTTWHHFAIARSGNTIAGYLDGTQKATATLASTVPIKFSNLQLGLGLSASASFTSGKWNMDEFRLSSVARYTTGFTPSTSAFAAD